VGLPEAAGIRENIKVCSDRRRLPSLTLTSRLRVVWIGNDGKQTVLADTTEGYRVLETSHPPTYYLPVDSIKLPLTPTSKTSFCEVRMLNYSEV
jgi:uncharacterized protein (DUF427 family)